MWSKEALVWHHWKVFENRTHIISKRLTYVCNSIFSSQEYKDYWTLSAPLQYPVHSRDSVDVWWVDWNVEMWETTLGNPPWEWNTQCRARHWVGSLTPQSHTGLAPGAKCSFMKQTQFLFHGSYGVIEKKTDCTKHSWKWDFPENPTQNPRTWYLTEWVNSSPQHYPHLLANLYPGSMPITLSKRLPYWRYLSNRGISMFRQKEIWRKSHRGKDQSHHRPITAQKGYDLDQPLWHHK